MPSAEGRFNKLLISACIENGLEFYEKYPSFVIRVKNINILAQIMLLLGMGVFACAFPVLSTYLVGQMGLAYMPAFYLIIIFTVGLMALGYANKIIQNQAQGIEPLVHS